MWSILGLCLAKMTSHSEVFRRLSIKVSAMGDASKASFKTTVTLFFRKKFNISLIEVNFNI